MRTQEGPVVVTASVDEVMDAIETLDLGAPWADVAPNLRLALPRRRPLPPGTEDLPFRDYPPGIRATLGLDVGPAMLFVTHEQLTGWGVSADRAFEQALVNVGARVGARKQFALLHERILDVPTVAFQSREGWASSLLLLPHELARVLGSRDGLVIAPMRDVLLLLPLDSDPDFAWFLLEEFAAEDMNALDLPVFALVDGQLSQAMTVADTAEASTLHH